VKIPTLSGEVTEALFRLSLFLLLCVSPAFSQKAQSDDGTLPKHDLHTETKTKGVVDEVKLLPLGTRKDFPELICFVTTRASWYGIGVPASDCMV
jgi:hypothetical protein